MLKQYRTPLTAIGLFVVQMGLATAANAQAVPTTHSASDEAHVSRCALLTGTDRLACFDLLQSRLPGTPRLSWLGNTAEAARSFAVAPTARQFVGTAQSVSARPFAFIDNNSPL